MKADPVIAWRRWVVVRVDDRYRLASWTHPTIWEPGEPVRAQDPARWRRSKHRDGRAPREKCYCGIYAFRRPEHAMGWDTGPIVTALGQVALWGRTIVHTGGYRGELAYPQRLRIVDHGDAWVGTDQAYRSDCRQCYTLHPLLNDKRARYGLPLRKWCDRCSARAEGIALHDVQEALLSDYAVEICAPAFV